MKKTLLAAVIILLSSTFVLAQKMKITGKVTDSSGKLLEKVLVQAKSSSEKTETGSDGKYSIEVEKGSVILFSHKQMVSKEVTANESKIDVVMASADDFFDLSLEELMELEVTTASKTKQSLAESPASVIVITAQNIRDRGYHHLEEILHDLPGFDFNKNYGNNYSTTFMRGYRSENSDRFILMFDGILENDIWKQTTWMSRQYPVTQIKQIEILYGPASALYGTNAFSGIINVITKKGDEVGLVNATTTGGSWGRKNVEVSSGMTKGKFYYNVTGKYMAQDDLHQWDDFDAISGDSSNFSQTYLDVIGNRLLYNVDGKVIEEEFQTSIPSVNYGIHANLGFAGFTLTALNWTKKESEAYFYNPFKRSGPWTQWYENNQGYMLSHDMSINEKLSLSSNVTYRNHKIVPSQEGSYKYYTAPLTDVTDPDYTHSQSINPSDFTTFQLRPRTVTLADGTEASVSANVYGYNLQTSDASLEEKLTYTVNEKLNFIGGGRYTYTDTQEDYQYSIILADMPDAKRHQKNTFAGYAQAIYKPIDLLSLTLGGRYENQKDENGEGYSVFTPRASAVINASENIIFRCICNLFNKIRYN